MTTAKCKQHKYAKKKNPHTLARTILKGCTNTTPINKM